MTTKKPDDLDHVDELVTELSEAEREQAEHELDQPRGKAALRELATHTETVLAEARRRALRDAADANRRAVSVPARIAAMSREAVLARLAELADSFGGKLAVQYRQRDLSTESDDDLRTLLADLEAQAEDSSGGAGA